MTTLNYSIKYLSIFIFCTYLNANLLKEKCYVYYCQQSSYYAYLLNVHLYDAVLVSF